MLFHRFGIEARLLQDGYSGDKVYALKAACAIEQQCAQRGLTLLQHPDFGSNVG
jgi:hypothetical protein